MLAVALSLGATFAHAAASYRWIEMPVRRQGFGATWAAIRGSTTLLAGAAVLVALAALAVATAPEKSQAQLAVERGEQAIAEQSAGDQATVDGAATTPVGPAWPAELALPPGDLMVGFGDSVLSGAAPALYERFPGLLLDAEPIRQWKDAPAVVQRAVAAGTLRPVVVLAFGTNAGLESAGNEKGLRAVLDALGPGRRVVLVNTVGVSDWVPSTNAELAEISGEYPSTIVMDWHATVAADPDLLHSDRTHPNFDGIQVYADQLADTIATLGPGG
jgi:lysophospholipase L1-like esterase